MSQLAVAKCSACEGRFTVPSELLDCGLRCPHCQAIAEIHADNGGAAQADVANTPGLAGQPATSALPSRPPHRLRVLGRGKWLAAGRRLPGIRFSASNDTARPPRSLMAVIFGSPGVIISVVGAVVLAIVTIIVGLTMMGGSAP